jgi:TatD DNase family protein
VDGVLNRAAAVGMVFAITVGTDLADSLACIEIARRCPNVFAAVGIHPHNAEAWDTDAARALAGLGRDEAVVALGETGLDFFRNRSPQDRQREAFLGQLALAKDLDLPVVVHSRDAHEETLAILTEAAPPRGGVMHCFSGDRAVADRVLSLGFHISFSGTLTYPGSKELREVARAAPADRILVETDAPFLAPQPVRGKTNEPAFVAHTLEALAGIRNGSVPEIGRQTTQNARLLFRIPLGL